MESEMLYVNTRPVTQHRSLAGTDETVSASSSDGKTVLLQWQRSDRAAQSMPPVQMTLDAGELRGIVAALDECLNQAR